MKLHETLPQKFQSFSSIKLFLTGQGRSKVMKKVTGQGRAGQVKRKFCRVGQGQVMKIFKEQVTGCKNVATCRPLIWMNKMLFIL